MREGREPCGYHPCDQHRVTLAPSAWSAMGGREHRDMPDLEIERRRNLEVPRACQAYFRFEPTFEKVVLSLEPIVVMAAMAATAMSEAIRPYSMAVAPDSSRRKRDTVFIEVAPMRLIDSGTVAGRHEEKVR